jgi:hypothetical protein
MTIRAAAASPLLLITVDRLPAWMLPPWGCGWVAMPALAEIAARGVIFDRLVATTDDPLEVAAEIAGRSLQPPAGAGGLAATWPLLAAAGEAGLSPAVVTDDPRLAAAVAESAAAGDLMLLHLPVAPTASSAAEAADTNLGRVAAATADLLATGTHRLTWCHLTSLGEAWDAPEEFRDAYIDPEDPRPPDGATPPDLRVDGSTDPDLVVGLRHVLAGQLTLLDRCLALMLAAIPAADASDWTILVAGVRGLGLGLHGRLGCGPMPPYGELIHLPAVLVDHRERMAAQRFGGLVTPADLGTTLLEHLGRPPPPADDPRAGRSLRPLLDDWRGPDRDRVVCPTAQGTAVITPAWQLVTSEPNGPADVGERPRRLYAKPDDFFELSDVADRVPDVAEELGSLAALATARAAEAWTIPLSDAAVRGV